MGALPEFVTHGAPRAFGAELRCQLPLYLIRLCSSFLSQRAEMTLSALRAQARLQNNIKATITIAITVAVFFICYVPAIVYAGVGRLDGSHSNSWLSFLSWLALYFSSAVNPIIYYLRTNRFRSVFKQFIKDPFGSKPFKETPRGTGEGKAKPNQEGVAVAKKDGDSKPDDFQPTQVAPI